LVVSVQVQVSSIHSSPSSLPQPSHPTGFAAYGAAAALALAPTLLLPVGALASHPAKATKRHGDAQATSLASRVAALLTPRAACFYGLAICLGFATSVTACYLPLYLHDTLGGSKAILGVAIAVACAAEIPVFYFSAAFVRKLGARRVLDVAAAAFVVRLLGYTVAGSAAGPAAVVPLEALHGLAFAGAWAAGTERCAALAPPGLKSTAQSLFSAAYVGVGGGRLGNEGGCVFGSPGRKHIPKHITTFPPSLHTQVLAPSSAAPSTRPAAPTPVSRAAPPR
jgi:MFS_1 like family